MTRRQTTMVIAVLALGGSLFAQGPRRDGRWEVKMDMQMAGISLPTQTMTQCITPAQAADPQRAVPPAGRGGRGGDCKVSDYMVDGAKVTWKMTCSEGTGTGEFVYAADTYTGTMKMSMQGQEMVMKYAGKRVGDCTQ